MPIFYFHVCNGTGFVEDEEGRELADQVSARECAVEAARDIMTADLRRGELDLTSFIEVEDSGKRLLFTLTFGEAVQIKAAHVENEKQARRRAV
jgi:hypothetical protein